MFARLHENGMKATQTLSAAWQLCSAGMTYFSTGSYNTHLRRKLLSTEPEWRSRPYGSLAEAQTFKAGETIEFRMFSTGEFKRGKVVEFRYMTDRYKYQVNHIDEYGRTSVQPSFVEPCNVKLPPGTYVQWLAGEFNEILWEGNIESGSYNNDSSCYEYLAKPKNQYGQEDLPTIRHHQIRTIVRYPRQEPTEDMDGKVSRYLDWNKTYKFGPDGCGVFPFGLAKVPPPLQAKVAKALDRARPRARRTRQQAQPLPVPQSAQGILYTQWEYEIAGVTENLPGSWKELWEKKIFFNLAETRVKNTYTNNEWKRVHNVPEIWKHIKKVPMWYYKCRFDGEESEQQVSALEIPRLYERDTITVNSYVKNGMIDGDWVKIKDVAALMNLLRESSTDAPNQHVQRENDGDMDQKEDSPHSTDSRPSSSPTKIQTWFWKTPDGIEGPAPADYLAHLCNLGVIPKHTKVQEAGEEGWDKLENIPQISDQFGVIKDVPRSKVRQEPLPAMASASEWYCSGCETWHNDKPRKKIRCEKCGAFRSLVNGQGHINHIEKPDPDFQKYFKTATFVITDNCKEKTPVTVNVVGSKETMKGVIKKYNNKNGQGQIELLFQYKDELASRTGSNADIIFVYDPTKGDGTELTLLKQDDRMHPPSSDLAKRFTKNSKRERVNI